jgi:hypothetical protein
MISHHHKKAAAVLFAPNCKLYGFFLVVLELLDMNTHHWMMLLFLKTLFECLMPICFPHHWPHLFSFNLKKPFQPFTTTNHMPLEMPLCILSMAFPWRSVRIEQLTEIIPLFSSVRYA